MKKSLVLILFAVLCFMASTTIMGIVASYLFPENATDSLPMFIMYSGTFLMTILSLGFVGRAMRWYVPSPRPRLERIDPALILLAILIIMAIDVVSEPLVALFPQTNLDALYDMMNGGLWAIITGVFAAPILEEFLFRGFIQTNLVRFTNPYIGIALSALIFGTIHLIPQQIITATLAGLVLGSIYYFTHSLATVIVIHLLNNGLAYTFWMYFGEQTTLTELLDINGTTYAILYTVCVLLLILMAFLTLKRLKKQLKRDRMNNGCANIAQ